MGLRCGCTGVFWRVVGWRREGGDELVEVQGLVENGAVRSQAGGTGRVGPLGEELESTGKQRYPDLAWLAANGANCKHITYHGKTPS